MESVWQVAFVVLQVAFGGILVALMALVKNFIRETRDVEKRMDSLELSGARFQEKYNALERRIDDGFLAVNRALEGLEGRLETKLEQFLKAKNQGG